MNNKGFTLIELIATIVLLSIIAIISFVSINSIIGKSKVSNCESLVMSIKNATIEYISDNRYKLNNIKDYRIDASNDKIYRITANILIDNNNLKTNVTDDEGNIMFDDPFSDEDIEPNSVTIRIELNEDYTAKNVTIEAPLILNTCSNE